MNATGCDELLYPSEGVSSCEIVCLFIVCVKLGSCEVFIDCVRSCHLIRSCELVFMSSCNIDAIPLNKGNVFI